MLEMVAGVAKYAGVLALAAFAGTLLGGIALSFFWKHFGPWKLLEESKLECQACRLEREVDARKHAEFTARLADLQARYDILLDAAHRAGFGLHLGKAYKG